MEEQRCPTCGATTKRFAVTMKKGGRLELALVRSVDEAHAHQTAEAEFPDSWRATAVEELPANQS